MLKKPWNLLYQNFYETTPFMCSYNKVNETTGLLLGYIAAFRYSSKNRK